MTVRENVAVMLEVFKAVERRDQGRFLALCHPDVELHWPPSLPYGGSIRGIEAMREQAPEETWSGTWTPLQPTEAERRLDPRVVAASADEVVVLWRQRGADSAGTRFDGEVLALYRMREGKLARAQMFYFDTVAAASFLADAARQTTVAETRA
jgi:ketosteroid isomerase-like protein